jgi:hypothetical protein
VRGGAGTDTFIARSSFESGPGDACDASRVSVRRRR